MATDPQIVVTHARTNYEDFRASKAAPVAKLPALGPDDLPSRGDRRLAIENRRAKYAQQLARKRWTQRGRNLGRLAGEILHGLDPAAELQTVAWQDDRVRWLITVLRQGREFGIPLDPDTVAEAVDNHILAAEEQVAHALRAGIGLTRQRSAH